MKRITPLLLSTILLSSFLITPAYAMNLRLIVKDDLNSNPIGVTVTVNETGDTYYFPNGIGTIPNLTTGTYHLILKKFGYWTQVLPVTLLDPSNYPSENLTIVTRMAPYSEGPYYISYELISPDPNNLTLTDDLYMRFILKPYSGIGEGTDDVMLQILINPLNDGQNLELNRVIVNGEDYPVSSIISLGDRPKGFDLILQFITDSTGTDRVLIKVMGMNPTTSEVLFDKNITVHYAPIPNITSTEENETPIGYNPNENAEQSLWHRLIVIALMFVILNALYYGSKRTGY